MILTSENIHAVATGKCGFNAAQLTVLGVPVMEKGWLRKLVGKEISEEQYQLLRKLSGADRRERDRLVPGHREQWKGRWVIRKHGQLIETDRDVPQVKVPEPKPERSGKEKGVPRDQPKIMRADGKWPWEDVTLTRYRRYQLYLVSPHWYYHRARAHAATGRLCTYCKALHKITTHHLSYINLGHEPVEDLMVLCWTCHKTAEKLHLEDELPVDMKRETILAFLCSTDIKIKDQQPHGPEKCQRFVDCNKKRMDEANENGWFHPEHSNY